MKNMASLRIIWAIAAKDIIDAIKNKTSLSMLIGVAVLVASSQLGPLLLGMAPEQRALVYDAGRSALIGELKRQDDVLLRGVNSEQALKAQLVGHGVGSALGLVIPPDFDRMVQMVQAGEPVVLEGYAAYWVDGAGLRAFFEQRLGQVTGQAVSIQVQTIYPSADLSGQLFTVTSVFVLLVISICVILVPFLIIEEKKLKTFSVLLLSPAGIAQLIAGKALAGLVYGLGAAGVVLVLNHYMVLHWAVALLAACCGAVFGVAVGLLMGSLFDEEQSLSLWTGLLMLVLLGMAFLDSFAEIEALAPIMPWVPTAALGRMFQLAFVEHVALDQLALYVSVVAGWALLLYAAVAWRVRRLDR